MSVKEGICNTVKPKHASVHIWQAAMHVKVYLPEREREIAEEKKKEKTPLGRSFLAMCCQLYNAYVQRNLM